jgi:hypothetical protein
MHAVRVETKAQVCPRQPTGANLRQNLLGSVPGLAFILLWCCALNDPPIELYEAEAIL